MSEIRALLLTDVVDSTKLSAKIGDDAMAEVWTAHDRAARDLLPAWRGREIDKTDGMLLMFDSAVDAVNYALAYHRALAALPTPLKARAGLHVGPVLLRENSAEDVARGAKPLEVEGLAKPTAARVMSVAAGGQTLLTPEAREDLGQTTLKVQSHGHWMIKGVPEPVELFEVGEPQARFVAPPDSEKVHRVVRVDDWWMPVREIPNNLPLQPSSFVGRERELEEVKSALAGARLVTLLGMGGLGKTRLSLQVASEVMHQFIDGVWFVDLSPIRDAELVASEAAHVLGVTEEPGRPLLQTLCAHLKQRRVLLILDNCEHLIKAAADLAHAIVRAAPNVRIVSSSREPLHVPGEKTYPILPLPVPKKDDGLETLAKSTAVRLFVERAQAHKPAFALTEREAPLVAELVARLEGIPLALELAAARVRSMSVLDINARLKHRYKLLTGGGRVLQERQQTLRALVDWSYDLLEENEKCVLDRLAVFVGGFDLAAAEAVCGADPVDSFEVLDLLGSLVEKSLVMLDERDEGSRYRMLETIREYAREKLDERGEDAPATAARHCEHYFAFAKEAREGVKTAEQAKWIARVETDLDNLRAATSLALAGGVDPFIAVKLAVAMQSFWLLRGYTTEGRNVVRAALALPAVQESDMAQAWALYVGAALAYSQSDHPAARRMLETCLELRRKLGNKVDVAATLSTLALARMKGGDAAGAVECEHEALEIFRQLGDRIGEVVGLIHMGKFSLGRGDDEAARERLNQGLTIALEIGNREAEGECELLLGELDFDAGNFDGARSRFARSLAVCREAADRHGEANALWSEGRLALSCGDAATARQRLSEALRAFQEFEMREELLGCLEDCAVLHAADGQIEVGVRLASAASAMRERLALVRSPRTEAAWKERVATLTESLPEPGFGQQWEEGKRWGTEEAVRSALAAAMPGAQMKTGAFAPVG
ncbi:MAG: tetratricopeptide repeat protein [Burkholderiales bacterium]|nr:tetratricopeptide repeat protein [Burkholderiales bacterium]